jgi:HAD superfamily hydrolase (TIGR01509 family)
MRPILFDWDGTLVDSLGALYDANVAVMELFGLPFDEPLYRRHFTADWRIMYRRLGVPFDRLEEANDVWMRAYEGGRRASLFPGVREALAALARTDRPLGLVTAGHRDVVGPQLDRLELRSLFTVAVFGDDHPVHKPDPAPLQAALVALGCEDRPGDATYVGDSPDDMRMARLVGTHAVGIASLLGDPAELTAAGAHEVAASVADWVADREVADREVAAADSAAGASAAAETASGDRPIGDMPRTA